MKFDQGKFGVPKAPKPVTEQDVKKIFDIDAVYSNKFYLNIQSDGIVRLCFAEIDPTDNFMTPRYVVAMTIPAYASLVQLLSDNMKNIELLQKAANDMNNKPKDVQ